VKGTKGSSIVMKCRGLLLICFCVVLFVFPSVVFGEPTADQDVAHIMNISEPWQALPPIPQQEYETDVSKEGMVISTSVNIRSGPGLEYEVVGSVSKGDKLTFIKYKSNGWYAFSMNDQICWIYAWFIYIPEEPVCIGIVEEDNVNFRKSPDSSSEVISVLQKDTQVYIHARDNEYYFVEFDGTLGWIMGKLVETNYKTIGLAVVKGDKVNIRAFPDLGAAVTEIADKNDFYATYGCYNGWYRIKLNDGNDAWIKEDYVEYAPYLSPVQTDYPALNVLEPPSEWDGMKLIQQLIVNTAKKYLGVPYVWGGESPRGFDCSGFTLYVYKDFGFRMAHFAATQANYGKYVPMSSLKAGDLVFFAGQSGSSAITHVGIYIGNNQFIHASSSGSNGKRVVISELSGYYLRTYKTARRIFDY
jgi:cell wall-associated NlpC family hydrolase